MSGRDIVRLTGLRVRAIHGVYADEREHEQEFVVDAVCSLSRPATDDDLDSTLDYARLARRIEAEVTGEPVNLIETLAQRIAQACLEHPLVRRARITVHKPQAPLPVPVDDVSVTVVRSRRR